MEVVERTVAESYLHKAKEEISKLQWKSRMIFPLLHRSNMG